jgi:hypothetical protein
MPIGLVTANGLPLDHELMQHLAGHPSMVVAPAVKITAVASAR